MAEQIKPGIKPVQPQASQPKTVPPLKNKVERFKELAPKRTRGVLKALEVLGNCSNKSGYDYTTEDVSKIFGAIEKKVLDTRTKFSQTGKIKDIGFSL